MSYSLRTDNTAQITPKGVLRIGAGASIAVLRLFLIVIAGLDPAIHAAV
jgi:hypothetical protein